MELSPVIAIRNRPGVFAVLSAEAARTVKRGSMKLFLEDGDLVVETITRNRRPIWNLDPYARLVFFAIDQDGGLTTEQTP